MKIELADIPELDLSAQAVWQVKALVIDGKSPALDALERWSRENPKDYKRIINAIRHVSCVFRSPNPKHAKKNENPDHGDVYEFLSYTGKARLMFFYTEKDRALIICTNAHDKGNKDQDAAFARCAAYRKLYLEHHEKKH